jgi:hypothetical protein
MHIAALDGARVAVIVLPMLCDERRRGAATALRALFVVVARLALSLVRGSTPCNRSKKEVIDR